MGKMKEQFEQIYLANNQNEDLEQPTFIGLIDLIKRLGSPVEQNVSIDKSEAVQKDFHGWEIITI